MLTMQGAGVAVLLLWANTSLADEAIPVFFMEKHCWGGYRSVPRQCLEGPHLHVAGEGQMFIGNGAQKVRLTSEVDNLVNKARSDLDAKAKELEAQMKAADEKVRAETVAAINSLPNRLLAEPAKAELVAAVLKELEPKLQQMKQELQVQIDALKQPALRANEDPGLPKKP